MEMNKNFDKETQRQVAQVLMEETQICQRQFKRGVKISKFANQNKSSLRIRLMCKNSLVVQRLIDSLLLHVKHSSPYIQYYSEFMQNQQKKNFFSIKAEKYRFTLAEMIEKLKQYKNAPKLPKQTTQFIIVSIIEIYKYILYLVRTYNPSFDRLKYQICPQNLAINSEYRLILINPCVSNLNLKRYPEFQNKFLQLKSDIYHTLKNLGNYIEDYYDNDYGFTKWMKQTSLKQQFNLQTDLLHEQVKLQGFIQDFNKPCMIPQATINFFKITYHNIRDTNNSLFIDFKREQDHHRRQMQRLFKHQIDNIIKEEVRNE